MGKYVRRPHLLHNIASLGGLHAINFALTLVIMPHLTRALGVEGWGQIVFVQLIVNYLIWFGNWSFYLNTTKKIAVNRENHAALQTIYSSTVFLQWGLTIIAVLLLLPLGIALPQLRTHAVLCVISAGLLIGNALQPLWFLNGMESIRESAFIQIASKMLALPFIFLLIKQKQDAYIYLLINAICSIFTGFFTLYWIKAKYQMTLKFTSWSAMLDELKEGGSLFFSTVWANLYGSMVPMVLGLIAGPTQLGYYNLADRVRSAVIQLTHPIMHALFPRMCSLFKEDRQEAFELMRKMGFIILPCVLFISIGVFVFSSFIVHILAGSGFDNSVPILRIISFTIAIIAASEFLIYQWLIPSAQNKLLNYSKILTLIICFILAYPMIAYNGAKGAAWLSFLSELLIMLIIIVGLFKKSRRTET